MNKNIVMKRLAGGLTALALGSAALNVKTSFDRQSDWDQCIESERVLRQQRDKMLNVLIENPIRFFPNNEYCLAYDNFEKEKIIAFGLEGKCNFLEFSEKDKKRIFQMRIAGLRNQESEEQKLISEIRSRVLEAACLPVEFELIAMQCQNEVKPLVPLFFPNGNLVSY